MLWFVILTTSVCVSVVLVTSPVPFIRGAANGIF